MTYVEVMPDGPIDSPVVLIGEAPAKKEIFKGEPFAGSAGKWLDKFLDLAQLDRSKIRLTNLSKRRAPGDKISNIPRVELEEWRKKLIYELNIMPNIKVIVPLGNYAMEAVTGQSGISKYRGTPMHPISDIRHNCVVIPTYHPSNMHYDYRIWPLIVADLTKVKLMEANNFNFTFPQFNFKIKPTFDEVMETLEMLEQEPNRLMTIDIENPRGLLSAIGIAWSRYDAICIPFYLGNGDSYWTLEQEAAIWKRLAEVLPKLNLANQNVMFDWSVMHDHGIDLKMPTWDPMLMHHCLYSEMPHRLDIITSIYTDLPYYKTDESDEGASLKGSRIVYGDEERHWTYNCYDVVGALWAIEELKKELEEEKMLDVYIRFYAEMIPPLYRMNIEGAPVDVTLIKEIAKDFKKQIEDNLKYIKAETGVEVYVPMPGEKPIPPKKRPDLINLNSAQQVAKLLYDYMGMARYKSGFTGKDVLEKLAYKYKTEVPLKIIEIKSNRKQIGLFAPENILNGRIYCQFSLGRAKTGRLASRKSFNKTGMNLQNVKRGIQRRFFIAEKGHVLLYPDQKGADARIVAYLSRDKKLIDLFESGKSIHIENAKNVFGVEVTKDSELYLVSKRLIHGGNYGMGPMRFAMLSGLSFSEAKKHLEAYFKAYPGIRDVFHAYVRRQITKYRMLYNPFGRRMVFFGPKDYRTFNIGYSFIPQSTIADLNKIALKFIDKYYKVLLELHDGISISVPKNEIKSALEVIEEAYSTEVEIWGEKHRIPVEITIGNNLDEMEPISLKDF